ncbi:hypothetical protein KEM48_013858 [Puccinia striiformis f. sp. tritici PST-130]|nr:hypothetical protein KEM48_013858 [Puccinia striiformis f. sp. tritici PST-130]
MNQAFSILSVVIALVSLLEFTEGAVVGHHPDSVRKSLQRKTGSEQRSPFLLFRRASEAQQDETDSLSFTQGLRFGSELPDEEDTQPHSFMMISTSTFSSDDILGANPFGEPDDSPGILSVDMTIISFDDSPTIETRKVARRFGSRGPLSIERSYSSYDTDSSNEPASTRLGPYREHTAR